MAQHAGQGGDPGMAVDAIVIAALSNTLVKAGMVAVLGSAALRRRVLLATALIAACGVASLAWR